MRMGRRRVGFTHHGSAPALPAPTVSAISPAFALTRTANANLLLTVTGTNFQAGAVPAINGVNCTNVTVVNSTTITCNPGALAADGLYNVTVTNPDTQVGTLANGYRAVQSLVWFRESQNVTISGGKVTQQVDISGNSLTGAQATTGMQPVVGSAALNGHDVIDYAGGSPAGCRLENTTASLFANGAGFTFLYIGDHGTNNGILGAVRSNSIDLRFALRNTGGGDWVIYQDGNGGRIDATGITTEFAGFFKAAWIVPDRVGADLQLWVGGVQKTLSINTAISTETGPAGFCVDSDMVDNQGISSKVAEFAIVGKALSTAERQAWEANSTSRYAV